MNTQSFDAFVPRLRSLEGELSEIRRDLVFAIHEARATEPATVHPAAQPVESPAETAPPTIGWALSVDEPPNPMRANWPSFEQLIGGKALNLAGLLLVFLGAGFFLKVAFDHNWIAPPERVALGLAVGIALIVYAQVLARRDARYFSDGITALGASIQFLALYAAGPYYKLLSPVEVLVGMAAVSSTLAALGWYHRSERLGVLGGIAGFLAPLLIGATTSNEWMLACYLTVFVAGLLLLGELLESKLIAPLALIGTLCYGVGHFYGIDAPPIERVDILGLLYATFAVAGWIVTRLRPASDPMRTAIACITLGTFVLELCGLLSDQGRTLLAEILFALAAVHVSAAALLRSRYQLWLAAAALAVAIPVHFHGAALAVGWASEALALFCTGLVLKDRVLRAGGLGLLGLGLLSDLALVTFVADAPLWNERFVSLGASIVALFGCNAALALKPLRTAADDRLSAFLRTTGHAVALWMLTAETWDYASGGSLHAFGMQAANVAVSILWTLYATAMIAAGLRKRDAMLRWEGLTLIVTTVAKVLLFDLSSLDLSYRVLSGLIVGGVLIGISYAYQGHTAEIGVIE